MIPHLTRASGGFTTDLIVENLAVGQNTPTLNAYNEAGVMIGTALPTLENLETRTMSVREWFPDLDVSHVVIKDTDVRVTASLPRN